MLAPVGLPTFREALRAGAEIYQALKKLLDAARPQHQRRRRGRLRAVAGQQRRGGRAAGRGDRGRRLPARRGRRPRPGPGDARELYEDGKLQPGQREPHASAAPRWSTSGPSWCEQLPDRQHRGRPGGGRLGRLGAADAAPRRPRPARGRRPARDQHERLERAIEAKAANAILVKVNQIGTLTEAIDATRRRPRRRLGRR